MYKKLLLLLLLLTLIIEFRLLVLSTSPTNSVNINYDGEKNDQLRLDLKTETEPLKQISEQERIDTMVRAFQRLPLSEQERLGVDITKSIEAGSNLAKELQKAWDLRQKEVKEAMESVLKPAEYMAQLASILRGNTTSITEKGKEEEIIQSLIELESLVSDIDNARDFHTIGGWPILLSMINKDKPMKHQMYAAWTIGTAIKNSYDYQLWTLEKSELNNNKTCIQRLVNMLGYEPNEDSQIQRRSLYAISSAIRGNVDVQNALMNDFDNENSFLIHMENIVSSNDSHPELVRKAWALVSDMLDERSYVRQELSSELPENMKEQLDGMKLMGDYFCNLNWTILASNAIRKLIGNSNSLSYIDLNSNPTTITSVPLRATIGSLITVLQQIESQNQLNSKDIGLSHSESTIRSIIQDQLKQIINLKGESNKEIITRAEEVLKYF